MKKVWTELQGKSHSPSSPERPDCPRSPTERARNEWACETLLAIQTWRVTLFAFKIVVISGEVYPWDSEMQWFLQQNQEVVTAAKRLEDGYRACSLT